MLPNKHSKWLKDLEGTGAAMQNTQYERFLHRMLFIGLFKEQGVRNALSKSVFESTENFNLAVEQAGETEQDFAKFYEYAGTLPWMHAIGEAIDQFLDLACETKKLHDPKPLPITSELDSERDLKPLTIASVATVLANRADVAVTQITLALKEIVKSFPPDGDTISACQYVASYLKERGFFSHPTEPSRALSLPLFVQHIVDFSSDQKTPDWESTPTLDDCQKFILNVPSTAAIDWDTVINHVEATKIVWNVDFRKFDRYFSPSSFVIIIILMSIVTES
jgi:hypothetical protein